MSQMEEVVSKSRLDVEAALALLHADVDMTFPVLAGIGRWFPDVPLTLPLAVMDLGGDERRNLGIAVLEEMADVFDGALVRLSSGESVSTEELSEVLNPLWRELTGVFAPVLNEQFSVSGDAEAGGSFRDLPEDERVEAAFRVIGALTGLDEDAIRVQAKSSPRLRLLLTRLFGVDPDEL